MVARRLCRTLTVLTAAGALASACGDRDPAAPPAATTVEITPAALSLEVGGTQQLSARVLDQNGQPMSGQSVTWSSSDTTRVAVDGSGLARAHASGGATIGARAGAAQGSIAAVVAPQTVTTIEVTPATLALEVGQTQQLAAIVLDRNGQRIPDAAVSWSSSDTARITIDAAGLARARRSGSANVTAAAADAHRSVAATVRAPEIRLEATAAASGRIGPAGGTITARAANNTTFTLAVPAGALRDGTNITVTPVASMGSSTASAGLRTAVSLQPAGLTFLRPVTVTIELATPPNTADLIGFHFSDDGEELFRYPVFVSGRQLRFVLAHFSGVGVATGTFANLLNQPGTVSHQAAVAIAVALAQNDIAAVIHIFHVWYVSSVRPLLAAVTTEAAAEAAWHQYGLWHNLMLDPAFSAFQAQLLSGLADERAEGEGLAAAALRSAINDAHNVCLSDHDLGSAESVLQWMKLAELSLPPQRIAQAGIGRATVLANFCTFIEPILSLPDTLRPGEDATLLLHAFFRFGSDPGGEIPKDPFQVEIAQSGTTQDGISNHAADAFGDLIRVIRPADTLEVIVLAEVCYAFLIGVEAIPVCSDREITRQPTRLLHFDDFSNPTDTINSATSPSGEKFYGELTNNAFNFRRDGIGEHTSLVLEFDLYIIDSWNGNGGLGSSSPPDIIEISVVGGPTLLRTTFSNKPRDPQAYPGAHPGASNPAGTGALAIGSLGYPAGIDYVGDSVYRLRFVIPHTDDSIMIRIGPDQTSPGNELWGVDNLRLSLGT